MRGDGFDRLTALLAWTGLMGLVAVLLFLAGWLAQHLA
jgi:hypothetical protein